MFYSSPCSWCCRGRAVEVLVKFLTAWGVERTHKWQLVVKLPIFSLLNIMFEEFLMYKYIRLSIVAYVVFLVLWVLYFVFRRKSHDLLRVEELPTSLMNALTQMFHLQRLIASHGFMSDVCNILL